MTSTSRIIKNGYRWCFRNSPWNGDPLSSGQCNFAALISNVGIFFSFVCRSIGWIPGVNCGIGLSSHDLDHTEWKSSSQSSSLSLKSRISSASLEMKAAILDRPNQSRRQSGFPNITLEFPWLPAVNMVRNEGFPILIFFIVFCKLFQTGWKSVHCSIFWSVFSKNIFLNA